jgi:hypothetical protein
MPNDSNKIRRISPPEEIIGILCNGRDLALSQRLTQARDVIRAARIVADDYGLNDGTVFDRLSESVMSKHFSIIPVEFDNAFAHIRSLWHKISK